jgi:hypothetical protein
MSLGRTFAASLQAICAPLERPLTRFRIAPGPDGIKTHRRPRQSQCEAVARGSVLVRAPARGSIAITVVVTIPLRFGPPTFRIPSKTEAGGKV